MIYIKLSLVTQVFFYIFITALTEGYVTAPQIEFTDTGPDYFRLKVTVPQNCYPSDIHHSNLSEEYYIHYDANDRFYRRLTQPVQESESTWNYFIENLTPNTFYNIRVAGCNLQQRYTFKSKSTTCSALEIISINTDVNSAQVTFKRDSSTCDPSNYFFNVLTNGTVNPVVEPFIRKNNSIQIRHLEPKTEYLFIVNHLTYLKSLSKMFSTKQKGRKIHFQHFNTEGDKYNFTWSILDKDYFGTISAYLMSWEFHPKACPPNVVHEQSGQLSGESSGTLKILNPYTEYNFTLTVYRSKQGSSTEHDNFSTKFYDKFTDEEIPILQSVESDLTSITIFFEELNCMGMRGPLLLNYKAVGDEFWCESIPLNPNRNIQFSFRTNKIIVPDLTAYCTYNITIYISRTTNNWDNAVPLKEIKKKTKSNDVSEPIEELMVISEGEYHVHLRWKLPSKPNGLIMKYYIITPTGDYIAPVNKSVAPCALWPEYQCHDVENKHISRLSEFTITIIAINENYLTDSAFQAAIKYAKNRGFAQTIKVYAKESEPKEPYDVKATWTDDSLLAVSWKHPDQTNGILKHFKIWTTLEYSNLEVHENFSYPLKNGKDDYKFEYNHVVKVSLKSEQKYRLLKVSVTAHNIAGMSPGSSVLNIEDPPPPKIYNGDITIANLIVNMAKPQMDAFFEKMLVFKADLSQVDADNYTREITKIQKLLENPTSESEIKKAAKINQLIYTYSEENKNEPIVINGSTNYLCQNKNAYKFTIFTINEANNKRKVRRNEKKVIFKSQDDPVTSSN